jgi:ABC-type polysaccharide/polyol phosphate transport system ATPase subunit
MRSEPAIDICGVTKEFKLSGTARSLKTAIIDSLKKGGAKKFCALDDVSFSVSKGETVGLIGANGAGKSTLLSIIARTVVPTSGCVRTRGAISSLLELGAGFHPDLTGRENIILYGSIMGIPRETMKKRFDAIVEFSGLANFIDQPVRFYSSGMYVRLGFAVAVQVDPDILLIDEVLAVGDADFQRKCLDKMAEFRRAGKSMLVISHDMHTIRQVADRIAYLDHGKLCGLGEPDEIATRYEQTSLKEFSSGISKEWGTGEARITDVTLMDSDGNNLSGTPKDQVLRILIKWSAEEKIEHPVFGFSINDENGNVVFGSNTQISGIDIPLIHGNGSILLTVNSSVLHSGRYLMSFSLHSRDHSCNYHRLDNHLPVLLFSNRDFDGICSLPTEWQIR